jgi:phosphoesterase RecJ-like protein
MYKEIIEKINQYDKIIIHRHINPDGDALGSQIGLKDAIINTNPNKKVLITGKENKQFSFLGEMDIVLDSDYNDSLVIVLDTSTSDIIDDDRFNKGSFIIKIDHHKSGYPYGNINLVLENKISTALIIAEMVLSENLKLSSSGAKALFTGIVTDSGRFRYHGVDANTFYITAKLLEYGFDINEVYDKLYVEKLQYVKLRAKMVDKFKVKGNLAYMVNTYKEVLESSFDLFTISRGMVGVMGGIENIDIWVNFTEKETGEVLAEIRSSKYDVSKVAQDFGGGGHKFASGATLANFSVAEKMLETLQKIMEKKHE